MSIAINDLRRHTGALRSDIDAAVQRVLDRGWFVLGPEVEGFEQEFARWCGVGHCVSVANGTDALQLALQAVGVRAGDRVATVANAGMYGTTAILSLGAEPVFVDVEADTLLIDLDHLEQQLRSSAVAAVLVTHLYGRLAMVESLLAIARRYGARVVEDCAQAHGAESNGRRAGSFGDASCFSFYPTKNLGALGDGGAVLTNCQDVADRLRRLRQYGWSAKYSATEPHGRNSRLDELQAAVLRLKLERVAGWNERRRKIAATYNSGIVHPKVVRPQAVAGGSHVWHLYVVQTEHARRNDLREHLSRSGVGTDIHYPIPDHRQASLGGRFISCSLPVTEAVCSQVLTLPCFPELDDTEVERVIAAVNSW